jgi:hypothetical protein
MGKITPKSFTLGYISTAGLNHGTTAPYWHYAPSILNGIKLPVANIVSGYRIANVIGSEPKLVYRNQHLALSQWRYLSRHRFGVGNLSAIHP